MSINETGKQSDNYNSSRMDIIRDMYLAVAVLFAVRKICSSFSLRVKQYELIPPKCANRIHSQWDYTDYLDYLEARVNILLLLFYYYFYYYYRFLCSYTLDYLEYKLSICYAV